MPNVDPSSIASTVVFGTAVVSKQTDIASLVPTGIPSEALIGSPVVTNGQVLSPPSIASTTGVGSPTVSRGTGVTHDAPIMDVTFTEIPEVQISGGGSVVYFNDDFNGSAVDTSKWNVRNNTAQSNTSGRNFARNCTVANGYLSIRSGTDNTTDPGTYPWTMGYLDTIGKSAFAYGRWEARMRFPMGTGSQGYWPAFWLRDSNGSGEIDIMEAWGGTRDEVHATLWENTNGGSKTASGEWTNLGYDFTQWHTFALDKQIGSMKFYIDEDLVWSVSGSNFSWWAAAFDNPNSVWNIRLNLQIGSSWGGDPDGSTILSNTMDVDFVRVLSKAGAAAWPSEPITIGAPPVTGGDGNVASGGGSSNDGVFLVGFRAVPRLITPPNLALDPLIRSLIKTNIEMPVPAVVSGRPVNPLSWMKNDSTMTFTVGSGHIQAITPPKPVVTHPGGLATQYTWDASDLSNPPGSHGYYNLSTWPEHSGGPSWKSSGDYTPRVADKVVWGSDKEYHTYDRSVHFDATKVEHMWIDLGTQSQPFTWVFCGIINHYPQRTYGHYLLDSGKATPARDVDKDWKIADGNLGYRSLMLYQSSSAVLATHTGRDAVASGKHVKAPHDGLARPRVFIGVFNGANSWIGSYDRYNFYGRTGKIDDHNHRYFVTGRRQENVSDNLGSHMTLFEIRFFNQALNKSERKAQFDQLASKWDFNKYGRGT